MKKALVVGIDDYPSAKLNCCINDAESIASLLSKHADNSVNFDVRLEKDIRIKSQLKESLSKLFDGDCDTALFYFSGHGFVNSLGGYIVTPDSRQYDEGILMDEILKLANKSNIKDRIIILDCCFSGRFGSFSEENKTSFLNEGVTILTSSKSNEASFEINGHGIFTNLLIQALSGGASDILGHITPGSVYSYIDQALGPWEQRPVFKTNVTRFSSLRNVKPQLSVAVLHKIIEYFSEPEIEYSLDPSYEYTNNPDIKHEYKHPYAKEENTLILKNMQKYQSVGLVVPVEEEHMYFATMNSKTCKLTSLGHHYWRLVKNNKI